MKFIIALLAMLTVFACTSVPLTGDQAADCLNARNQVIKLQGVVGAANKALLAVTALGRPEKEIEAAQALVASSQADVVNAKELALELCAPPA